MGSCLTKKAPAASSPSCVIEAAATVSNVSATVTPDPSECKSMEGRKVAETEPKIKKTTHKEEPRKQEEEESIVKKEIFVIKHRKSHDRDRDRDKDKDRRSPPPTREESIAPSTLEVVNEAILGNNSNINACSGNAIVRTSSCTKEEVDAILIQCGRLSRSNSSGNKAVSSSARKYSGSKRSYDFDHDSTADDAARSKDYVEDDEQAAAEKRQHRQRHRQPSSSPSKGRRRTPSRERDQQQRSGSRERASGNNSGRRVSRSPGRRSENNQNNTSAAANSGNSTSNIINRPGKMVSVPATVSSLAMDKSNNVEQQTTTATIKRISVKRNVGSEGVTAAGSRMAASPRSQSPARANQQPSLSRSNSRKAEHSPYRRNPLSELDPNSLAYPQTANSKASALKPNAENNNDRTAAQGTTHKYGSRSTPNNKAATNLNHSANEQQQIMEDEKTLPPITTHITMTAVAASSASGAESLKPQTLTRSRSARRSRDLDINPESLLNPPPSYTTLLLEDIQNFHQKNNPSISLPACVTKACSIVEAVADLNSTTSSNFSGAFSEDRKNFSSPTNLVAKDPFVESEVLGSDDLMEPSFHKYVTVRRGTLGGGDMEEQESSGSNSFVGSVHQQRGFSSSSWEPNSADSTDRWTSRSNTRDDGRTLSPPTFQRHNLSESGSRDVNENNKRGLTKKKDSDHRQQTGIGRGRVSASRGSHMTVPMVAAAAAST